MQLSATPMPQAPAETSASEFWGRLDHMLDKKVPLFGGEVAMSMSAEDRAQGEHGHERARRRHNMKRFQKLEVKERAPRSRSRSSGRSRSSARRWCRAGDERRIMLGIEPRLLAAPRRGPAPLFRPVCAKVVWTHQQIPREGRTPHKDGAGCEDVFAERERERATKLAAKERSPEAIKGKSSITDAVWQLQQCLLQLDVDNGGTVWHTAKEAARSCAGTGNLIR